MLKTVLIIVFSALLLLAIILGIIMTCSAFRSGDKGVIALGVFIGVLLILTFGLILGPCGIYTVEVGEVVVVRKYGKIVEQKDSGLRWRNVFTTSIERVDTKVQEISIEKWMYVQDITNTTQALTVLASIQFQIDRQQSRSIVREFGSLASLIDKLQTVILGAVESNANGIPLETLITGQGKNDYQARLDSTLRGSTVAGRFYVIFTNIIVQEFIMEPELEEAIMKIRIAEANKTAAILTYKQETQKAVEEGLQAVNRAEADANATRVRAQGEASASMITAEAEAEIIISVAQAEAEALREKLTSLIENSTLYTVYNSTNLLSHIEYMTYLEKWGGQLPTTVVGDIAGKINLESN